MLDGLRAISGNCFKTIAVNDTYEGGLINLGNWNHGGFYVEGILWVGYFTLGKRMMIGKERGKLKNSFHFTMINKRCLFKDNVCAIKIIKHGF